MTRFPPQDSVPFHLEAQRDAVRRQGMRFLRTAVEPKILSRDEVEALVSKLGEACPAARVVLMYLHGAHAQGTQSHLSDIDIAVLLEASAGRHRKAHLDLLLALQEVCGREDLDLVVLNAAGPIIKDRVVRHGRLVYSRSERERVLFEAAAIKEALDYQHFSRAYDEALFRQLREGRFLGRP